MPFTAPTRTGSWVALRDLAGVRQSPYNGKALRVARGFLEDDPGNTYQGNPSPRYIVHGTIDGEEAMLNSPKGGKSVDTVVDGKIVKVFEPNRSSRDQFLEEAAEYLDNVPAGSYIDIAAEPVEGSQYVQLIVADSFDAE